MSVLSIKVPIRKKPGNLFNEPCMYGLVWFSFMAHQQLLLINAQSKFINTNRSISINQFSNGIQFQCQNSSILSNQF